MGELLSQDDLNALLGGLSEEKEAWPGHKAAIIGGESDGLLSQDDLDALLGGAPECNLAGQEAVIPNPEAPATENKGESMSQDEIDELLRQFDRDI